MSKLTTTSTCGMSKPRLATSVATRSERDLLRNLLRAPNLLACPILPCRGMASRPRCRSSKAVLEIHATRLLEPWCKQVSPLSIAASSTKYHKRVPCQLIDDTYQITILKTNMQNMHNKHGSGGSYKGPLTALSQVGTTSSYRVHL